MDRRASARCGSSVNARARRVFGREAQHQPRSGRWRSCLTTPTFGASSTDLTRILIADDHALFRSGLRALFESLEGIEVVGEAENGREAVELAEQLQPDIVLMDIQMPEMDGIEATRRLAASRPAPAVLVLTMHEDDESVFSAMRAGARGYLLKGAAQDDVSRAIMAVGRGEAIFGPAVGTPILKIFTTGN